MRPSDAPDAVRVAVWSLALPVLKRVVPLPALVRIMHRPTTVAPPDEARARRIAVFVRRALRLRGGDPNCLERSLLLYRYLPMVGLDADLHVGFRSGPDPVAPDGHAWITVGDEPFDESRDSLRGYSRLISFGRDGSRLLDD